MNVVTKLAILAFIGAGTALFISMCIQGKVNLPLVEIKQGKLKGSIRTDIDRQDFLAFFGIPYAKPPIGPLRFKAPQAPDPWTSIRDATVVGDACYSRNELTGKIIGSENCLVLNVYTRELPDGNNDLKPVMFYIHGGGFAVGSGSPDFYGPEYLMIEDIVLVTINYRLGMLGFLSLDDPSLGVPGNAGMKDQVMALKWVKDNIMKFNGDPNNVSIFGNSAGGASVHYQVLSPMAKGLFSRAIIQSGSVLNPWAQGSKMAKEIANKLGSSSEDEKEILQLLKETPVEKLYEVQEQLAGPLDSSRPFKFAPIIEQPSNEPSFISNNPIEVILSGDYSDVPIMFGYNSKEGFIVKAIPFLPEIESNVPWMLGFKKGEPRFQEIAENIKNFYFVSNDEADDQYTLKSDVSFIIGIVAAAKNHAKSSKEPVFLYRASIDTKMNIFKSLYNVEKSRPGASHADEIGYLFKTVISPEFEAGSLVDISIRRFCRMWANFAKAGNPTPDENDTLLNVTWKNIGEDSLNALDIGEELRNIDIIPEANRVAFWKEIFKQSPLTSMYL